MTLSIAIVGCGKIADGHIEEIQKMPERARVVAACDLEALMAEQVALRYGLPAYYDSFERLLSAERPDVVHITTPPGSHLPLALQALDAGAHVYVEKPLALDAKGARALLDHAEKKGKKVTVGYSYLFDPPGEDMRSLLAQGALGEVVHVDTVYGYNLKGPFGAAIMGDPAHWVHRLPGKLLHNNIDHLLYKVTELIPDDEPDIVAKGFIRREERYGDARDDLIDELRVMILGERVTAFGLFSSFARPVGHYAKVFGTKGTLHVDYANRTATFDPSSSLPSAFGRLVPAFSQSAAWMREGIKNLERFARAEFHYFSGLNLLFQRFYDAITGDGPPPIPYRDILRISVMMDEIFRQVPQAKRDVSGGAR